MKPITRLVSALFLLSLSVAAHAQIIAPVWVVPTAPIVMTASSTYFSCVRNDTTFTIPYSAQGTGSANSAIGYVAPAQTIVLALQNAPWGQQPYFTVKYRQPSNPLNVSVGYVSSKLLTPADVDVFGRVNCFAPQATFQYQAFLGHVILGQPAVIFP